MFGPPYCRCHNDSGFRFPPSWLRVTTSGAVKACGDITFSVAGSLYQRNIRRWHVKTCKNSTKVVSHWRYTWNGISHYNGILQDHLKKSAITERKRRYFCRRILSHFPCVLATLQRLCDVLVSILWHKYMQLRPPFGRNIFLIFIPTHGQINFFIPSVAKQPNLGIFNPTDEASISHTHTQAVGLLWKSDELVAEVVTNKTHNKQNRSIFKLAARFQPAIPASKQLQNS